MSLYLLFKFIYVNVVDVALKHFQLQLVWTVKVASYLRGRLVKLLIEEVALSKTRKGTKEYKNNENLCLTSNSTTNSLEVWFIVAVSVLEVFAPLSGETDTGSLIPGYEFTSFLDLWLLYHAQGSSVLSWACCMDFTSIVTSEPICPPASS